MPENTKNELDLSILLPVYGDAPYLEMTLESIKIQEILKFEVVIVLDRPNERQIKRTMELVSNFTNFKVLISPSDGISNALNYGLEHCLGTFIARIDSDDEMISHRLEIQREFLKMHSEYSCVGSQVFKIDHTGQEIGESNYPISKFWVRRILPIRNCIAHPSTMYRRADVLKVGGYRSQFDGAEDYDLWLRTIRIGEIGNLAQPLTRYRIWDGQNSRGYKTRKLLEARIVNSFSWIERKNPELANNLLSSEISRDDFGTQVNEILRKSHPKLWLLQEFKYFINFELSIRADKSKFNLMLVLPPKALFFFCRAAYLAISHSEQKTRNYD